MQAAPPVSAPTLVSPADGASGVSLTPTLNWTASSGASSYDVYFGNAPAPPYVATSGSGYAPAPLMASITYYWRVVAHNSGSSASSPTFSFTTSNSCTFTLALSPIRMTYQGGQAQLGVAVVGGCAWTATTNASWITITSGSGTGNGGLAFNVSANNGPARLATIALGNLAYAVMEGGSPASQFFNDVPTSDPYFDYVSLMNTDGITAGCSTSPSLYCPNTPVTRAQMSVFIVAAINRALGTSLTYTQTPYFQDVPSTSTYFPFVQRIKDLGITAGCSTSPALFCPDDSISQGQMAVFMIVGWMLENNLSTFTYTTTPYFTDVQPGDIYFKFVQKMRDLGIWMGCSQTQYCESSAVTRDQMAPMIMRSLLGAP
jgi:S-layer homology domain